MPPLGFEKYEATKPLTEAESLELAVGNRMRAIMERHKATSDGKYMQAPPVFYESDSVEADKEVQAVLYEKSPAKVAAYALALQVVRKDPSSQKRFGSRPIDQATTASYWGSNPVEYHRHDKARMEDAERIRRATNIMETLDLIAAKVEEKAAQAA
jgi:hypothetical protein